MGEDANQPRHSDGSSAETAVALLSRIHSDEDTASTGLLPLVYDELRRLAGAYMRGERIDHTLQPTALVHEAYLRMIEQPGTQAGAPSFGWKNRAHFLGVAAKAMRRVLVDHARGHNAVKRGGGGAYSGAGRAWDRGTLDEAIAAGDSRVSLELIELDDAVERLAQVDPRAARVVELRYFGGLTIEETAHVLAVSHTTVEDDWALARAWLTRELAGREDPG